MKHCHECGRDMPDAAIYCNCGHPLPAPNAASSEEGEKSGKPFSDRPNGETPIMVAWLAFVLSIVTGIAGWSMSDGYDADLTSAVRLGTASWIFFYVFLVFWPAGYIVKALSYLPSKRDD